MRLMIGCAVMMLAGCGDAGGDSANAAAAGNVGVAANGTDYVAAIRAMPPEVRKATLLRAIRDARQPCQQVTAEQAAGEGSWSARCEDGSGWLIAIARDGNAKVTGPVARR